MNSPAHTATFAAFSCLIVIAPNFSRGQGLPALRAQVLDTACLDCHDESTTTRLDLTQLDNELGEPATFRMWERIHDKIAGNEMPPADAQPLPKRTKNKLLAILGRALKAQSLQSQREGRVQLRRVTRTEFEYMLHDLLSISTPLAGLLPEENHSNGFDTVASGQGMSPLHVESYLRAADTAIDAAIQLEPRPETKPQRWQYRESQLVRKHFEDKREGEQIIIRELKDGIVMFAQAPYIFKVDDFRAPLRGTYRIRAKVAAFQTERPVIFALSAGDYSRGSTRYLGHWDLLPTANDSPDKENAPDDDEDDSDEPDNAQVTGKNGKKHEKAPKEDTTEAKNADEQPEQKATLESSPPAQVIELTVELARNEYIFPDPRDLRNDPRDGRNIWGHDAEEYRGSGIAIQWIEIEGPLIKEWPPENTVRLLPGIEIEATKNLRWERNRHLKYQLVKGDDPKEQFKAIIRRLAPRAFRRPLKKGEGTPLVELAYQSMLEGRSFESAVRTVCRGVVTSPQFLFFEAEPGKLDDFALAARLAAFLWKSIPDDTLYRLAKDKKLGSRQVLKKQVDRMLKDPKSRRFINDFADQWLQLSDLNATTPDAKLYPEYDDLLKYSILTETREFLYFLVDKNRSVDCLVDSDFTFLNRRLAEHYEVPGVQGQQMRRVRLPKSSPRGGLLTQASVLKVTANGTTTSPVRRGNWVLTHLLGEPPDPPPPGIGAIEPDTRGATTIRELLAKHRNDESCAKCHRLIDPPGFALESFDVIGGFREAYRCTENGKQPTRKLRGRTIWEYDLGLPVDPSGELQDGTQFDDMNGFKQLLLDRRDQIATNLIELLVTYSTGGEIQFADREEVARLVQLSREDDYGIRTMIHVIVQSRLFREK